MQVEKELAAFPANGDSLITIGVFDGVHLGHKHLISKLKELASQQGFRSIVVTFHKHPQEVLCPQSLPPFLTDAVEKAGLLRKEGVDGVIVLTFTPELAQLSATEFIVLLQNKLRMRGLVIGPDFALGREAKGTIPFLKKLGTEMGFSVTVVPPVKINGEIVSSTSIRHAMAEGDMERVRRLMGRPFSLHGKVIHGKGRGASLGYPTVNLSILPGQATPLDGVYATHALVNNQTYPAVTNVGTNPTFGNNVLSIESYLIDYHDDLYEQEVKIDFIHRLRGERKFENAEELVKQIYEDIKQTRVILKVNSLGKRK
jgi:riboflavin kinase / FMN adenylyltransferase